MTSLIDQFENEASLLSDAEKPIFMKDAHLLLPEEVAFAAVANDHLVVVLKNQKLIWFSQRRTADWSSFKEIDLSRLSSGNSPKGIFLDQSAEHLLIAFPSELFYLHRDFPKPKPLNKLKDMEVTAVGWEGNGALSATTTGPILLGTSRGAIYEMEISPDSWTPEQYAKQVYELRGGQGELAIQGLVWRRGGSFGGWDEVETNCFVVATTTERLYQFTGPSPHPRDPKRPVLQQLFNKYLSVVHEGFQLIPSELKYSRLEFRGTQLAWLTQTGVFLAQVDSTKKEEGLLVGTQMLPLDPPPPLDILLTDFHLLILNRTSLRAVNLLSQATVHEEKFKEKLKRITRDSTRNTIWIISENKIFGYRVNKEDRHVWKIYAEKGDWESAKNFCKGDPISLDEITQQQADHLFNTGKFEESALCYAETNLSFEKVALKFLQADQHKALKVFLKLKLERMMSEGGMEKAQWTMLILWIMDLLLRRLAEEEGDAKTAVQLEFDEFVTREKVLKCIHQNKMAVYNLLGSHGDEANLLSLAKRLGDVSKAISHHINVGQHSKALEELVRERDPEVWYRFAGALVEAAPGPFLNAVLQRRPPLDTARLFPALVAVSHSQPEELMRYLKEVAVECRETAVHNFLLSLYARHSEKKLKSYLAVEGRESSLVHYDILFGARVCREWGRTEGCVDLLALLGLWESSVDLALTVDVDLAKRTAALPSCPQHIQRKLWLKIAEHVVREKADLDLGMKFLKECDQIKIEDILPFFPDFSSIDHFRDAICSSLQEYNQHIQEVKEEMEEATKSAELIRAEIHSFRKKYTIIEEGDKCEICRVGLVLRPFYAFPCGHRFHSDCLAGRLPPPKQEVSKKDGPDSYLASQCLFCGDLAIELIEKGFFDEEEYEKIKREWE